MERINVLQNQAIKARDGYPVADQAMEKSRMVSVPKDMGFLGELPPKRRRFLESKLRQIQYPPGTQIIKKGRSGRFWGIVESGQVLMENGKGQSRTLTAGEHFGSEMLLFGRPSTYSISTQTETTLSVLHRADWITPSTQPRTETISTREPRIVNAIWSSLMVLITLILSAIILGPILLEISNNHLPDLMLEAGHSSFAEVYLRTVIRWQPDSAMLYGNLGDILVHEGRNDEAIEIYQQAITRDEYLPQIHNNLGVLYLENGQTELAVDHFLQSINLNLQNIDAYRNLGNAYYALEDWAAAANAYQGALDLDETLLDTRATQAGLLLYSGQLGDARQAWEEVLRMNPRHKLALQGLGLVALLEEEPSQAMQYLDAALYLDPDDTLTRLYIGLTLEALGELEEAGVEYQIVLENESDPNLRSLASTLLLVVQE